MGTGSAAPRTSQLPSKPANRNPLLIERTVLRRTADLLRAHPYRLALGSVVLAIALRFLIDPWLGDQMPYITFVLAVAVTGLYGGVSPALVTTLAGAVVAYWCFVPPRYQWGFQGVSDAVGFASYLAVAIGIVLLTRARNRAAKAAEHSLEEQINTARQLLDAQALFRAFMENSPGCAYLRDQQGEHVYMNAAARQILGVEGEAAGRTNAEWFSTETAQRLRAQDDDVLRSGRPKQFIDRIVHPDGERFWLTTKFPFVDQAGRRFVGGNSFDITDRLRAEEVLRQSERLAAAGQMASLLAHEVNNPLAALTNLVFLLQRQPLATPAGEYVTLAAHELQRLNHIAALTLGFYNESELPSRVDICKILDEVANGLLAMAAFQHIKLFREYRDRTETVGSARKIRQMLTNLMVNAFESGTQVVRVRVKYAYDWRQLARRGIRITIADAGRGISEADHEHVFEPFFTTKPAKGTGLGLWASKLIVLRKDGSIRLRSAAAGRTGTCVTVFLPLRTEMESAGIGDIPATRIA
jgi:PAS domain S-box-containing protein